MWVTVIPEEGLSKVVAQRLLAVAEHPGQVRVVTYPQFGYEVPGHVFLRFEEQGPVSAPEPQAPKTFVDGDTDLGALKRRGRPRKSAPVKAEEENQ